MLIGETRFNGGAKSVHHQTPLLRAGKGVEDGSAAGASPIAAEQLAKTHVTRCQPYRGPAHRRLAKVEAGAIATDTTGQHDEPGLRTAQIGHFWWNAEHRPGSIKFGGAGTGQKPHAPPAAFHLRVINSGIHRLAPVTPTDRVGGGRLASCVFVY